MFNNYEELPIDPRRERQMKIATLVVAILLTGLVYWGWTAQPGPIEGGNGVEQTWSATYYNTSCTQFLDQMTDAQRTTAAGDLLHVFWKQELDHEAKVPTAMAEEFRDKMVEFCMRQSAARERPVTARNSMSVTGLATGAYYLDPIHPS